MTFCLMRSHRALIKLASSCVSGERQCILAVGAYLLLTHWVLSLIPSSNRPKVTVLYYRSFLKNSASLVAVTPMPHDTLKQRAVRVEPICQHQTVSARHQDK